MISAVGLLCVLVVAGGVYWRSRLSPKLTDQDTLVLADFDNSTGDPIFDDTLKQAISVQLGQSPFLNILSEARTRATLRLMAKPLGTKVTSDVARDLCQRAAAKAYVSGAIGSLGSQYVIGLNAVNCETGDPLVQEQATADRKEHVLRVLGEIATRLRAKLGEEIELLALAALREVVLHESVLSASADLVERLYTIVDLPYRLPAPRAPTAQHVGLWFQLLSSTTTGRTLCACSGQAHGMDILMTAQDHLEMVCDRGTRTEYALDSSAHVFRV